MRFSGVINGFPRVLKYVDIIFSIQFSYVALPYVAYKMYEKNLISWINVNIMHHFWKG